MNRSKAREVMMQLLYQMEAQQDFTKEIMDSFLKQQKEIKGQKDYMESLFTSFTENREKIDETIEKSSSNWKLNRISKVDLALTRVAVTEMLFMDDIPVSVSINEAINLAKTFGTQESSRFINGILGHVAQEIK